MLVYNLANDPYTLHMRRSNHLALCPNCAANWRQANAETRESLVAALRYAVDPETTPTLAGVPVRLRFVEIHMQDLRALLVPDEDEGDESRDEPAAVPA